MVSFRRQRLIGVSGACYHSNYNNSSNIFLLFLSLISFWTVLLPHQTGGTSLPSPLLWWWTLAPPTGREDELHPVQSFPMYPSPPRKTLEKKRCGHRSRVFVSRTRLSGCYNHISLCTCQQDTTCNYFQKTTSDDFQRSRNISRVQTPETRRRVPAQSRNTRRQRSSTDLRRSLKEKSSGNKVQDVCRFGSNLCLFQFTQHWKLQVRVHVIFLHFLTPSWVDVVQKDGNVQRWYLTCFTVGGGVHSPHTDDLMYRTLMCTLCLFIHTIM